MAKKEIIAFDPPTEEEIMLIQPNNVTFGQYNVCLLYTSPSPRD